MILCVPHSPYPTSDLGLGAGGGPSPNGKSLASEIDWWKIRCPVCRAGRLCALRGRYSASSRVGQKRPAGVRVGGASAGCDIPAKLGRRALPKCSDFEEPLDLTKCWEEI